MRIRSKYLLWINGPVVVLLGVYVLTEQWSDRQDLLRLEAQSLQDLGEGLRAAGFDAARPRPDLELVVDTAARLHQGVEIMVLDRQSIVRFSSVAGRVGRQWHEQDIVEVLREGHTVTWKSEGHLHGEVAVLDVTVPVRGPGGTTRFAIHVARRMDLVEQLLRDRRYRHTLWALGSILIIGLVVNVVTLRWLIRPLNRVTALLAASRWYRPGRGAGDELQRLVETVQQLVNAAEGAVQQQERLLSEIRSFNEKLAAEVRRVRQELLLAQAELVRRERLAAIGEVAAGLAHEVRNPLHIIRGATDLLARSSANQEACQDIREEVDRINRFVNDLLDYTRPRAPVTESIEVLPVIRSACEAVRRTHSQPGLSWEVDCGDELELEIDADHLRQVLVNLLSNAVEATVERQRASDVAGATIRVRAWRDEPRVCIVVRDEGCGVSDEDLDQLFVPFFTRRPGGTGLGLSIVQRLLEIYGGTIEVRRVRDGHGTEVTVCFDDAARRAVGAEATTPTAPTGTCIGPGDGGQ